MFAVELEDRSLYEHDELAILDGVDGQEVVRALWVDPSRLDAPLYPDGLAALLEAP